MAAGDDLTVLEHNRIPPAPGGSVVETSLPLNLFDIPWLLAHPVHQLCFYDLPQFSDQSHFIQTIVPNLKHSLSTTLQHFFPLAGNLIVFPYTDNSTTLPRKPEIRYVEGDSVSLTIAKSTKDFDYLTGNHARKANEFYPLVPKLGNITRDSDSMKVPVLAIQVTLFAGRGICIGLTNHHAACDGNARVRFVRAWALIAKFGNDEKFLASGPLPLFDKSIIQDPKCVDAKLWSSIAATRIQESPPKHLSGNIDMVRASFLMTRDQINQVKKSLLATRPMLAHVSSFTIVCAHIWTCMTKTREAIGEVNGEDEREVFGCVADCRARLDPPIPATYFGNCLVACVAEGKRSQFLAKDGFVDAVELIGDSIHSRLKSPRSVYEGTEFFLQDFSSFPKSTIGVAGSPRFNIYDTDFGWGKPKKCEIVSIDYSPRISSLTISLSASRESKEDVEIGLALPKIQMDAFQTIFTGELNNALGTD